MNTQEIIKNIEAEQLMMFFDERIDKLIVQIRVDNCH